LPVTHRLTSGTLFSSFGASPTSASTPVAIGVPLTVRILAPAPVSLYWTKTAMTEYEIHPAIGIARVGSSRLASAEGFFLGPEPGGSPPPKYCDPEGNLKRQAARFRVFACRRDNRRRLQEADELSLASIRNLEKGAIANLFMALDNIGRLLYTSPPVPAPCREPLDVAQERGHC
jgi:L-Lysine epsilon oxidase N-terminal